MSLTIKVAAGVDYTATLANESTVAMVDATSDITGPKFTGQLCFNRTGKDIYRYDGTQWVLYHAMRLQTTDSAPVNNNTTLASSTQLTAPVGTNTNYVIECLLIYTATTTADFKVGFSIPSGATIRISPWHSDITAASINDPLFHDAYDGGATFSPGGRGTSQNYTCRPSAWLSTAGTAGNIVVQYAQNTAEASNAILKAGSWMRVHAL